MALFGSALLHAGLLELKIGTHGESVNVKSTVVLDVNIDKYPKHTMASGGDLPASLSPHQLRQKPAIPVGGMLPEPPTENSRYYFSSEVDVRAEPLQMQPLIYPGQAYQMRLYGKVKLRVYINEQGTVDSADVVEATPPGVFEVAALQALLSSNFSPAEKNGRKVKNQKLIEINFDPYETGDIANSSIFQ